MAKYVITREFRPEQWSDPAVDFTAVMKTMLTHELWRKCIDAVPGAEAEVTLSNDDHKWGWGRGRAIVEVVGDGPQA